MVSVLSAVSDQALKVPSLTRLEDPIGKWWQRTSGSPNDVLGSVGLGLRSARLVGQRHPQALGPALHPRLRATARLPELTTRRSAAHSTTSHIFRSLAAPLPNRAFARAPAT